MLDAPYPFPSAHTEYAYLSGRNVSPEYPMYDDTWGEVVLMSGLPGTGKDTWIRKELGILPSDNQSKVVDAATQRAKALLRKKQAFVWNATNITPQTRGRQVELFTDYGASVKIVYLETDTRCADTSNFPHDREVGVARSVGSPLGRMAMCLETSGSSEDENEKMERISEKNTGKREKRIGTPKANGPA